MSMEVRHKREPASTTRVSLDGKERSKNFINETQIRNGAIGNNPNRS
jgi:hypothetical protein